MRRRGSAGLQRVRAGTVGGSSDVYTLTGRPFKASELDDVWAYFEASIPSLIDRLSSPNRPIGLIDRSSFLTVLVPYVSAALVRGDDYDDRSKAFMALLINDLGWSLMAVAPADARISSHFLQQWR